MTVNNWQLRVAPLSVCIDAVLRNWPARDAMTTIEVAMRVSIERGIDVSPSVVASNLMIRECAGQVMRVNTTPDTSPRLELWVKLPAK